MKHFIIGTAGHVDHGKTVLVKALTGKDTDRLKEEKERGISIELGFAPFRLPSGILAGVVDVPGHERFIKNMLAGVGGMDMVLLVVAADEGIMPQTREHVDIINLLQIPEGIIVLTKVDLVDTEWTDMVKEEISDLVKDTCLEDAPIAEVSAVTGKGIPELVSLIDLVAGKLRQRSVTGNARMSVDRIFTITGFGTVVTGTLAEGRLYVGDNVEILPDQIEARVRGLQVHGEKLDSAEAGQRVAVNLAGIEREKIDRGSVLAALGSLKPSHRLDIRLKMLSGAEKPLANRSRVRVHIGTSEILARVLLLEGEELEPGETALAQLECEEPMVSARGDRLVIRSYSPMHTIGGGTVIEPNPVKHKRFNPHVIETLRTKEKGSPEELLVQFMASSGQVVYSGEELRKSTGSDSEAFSGIIDTLLTSGQVKSFSGDNKTYYVLGTVYRQKAVEMETNLRKFHNTYSLRSGISKEEIRSRYFTGLNSKTFNFLLETYRQDGIIKVVGESAALFGFEPSPPPAQAEMFSKIEQTYLQSGYQTPGWDEIAAGFKLKPAEEEILGFFTSRLILVKLEDGVLIHRNNLEKARENIESFLRDKGEMTLAEARDLLGTSRKFALPIMNFFDREKVTRRIDDKRVLY